MKKNKKRKYTIGDLVEFISSDEWDDEGNDIGVICGVAKAGDKSYPGPSNKDRYIIHWGRDSNFYYDPIEDVDGKDPRFQELLRLGK